MALGTLLNLVNKLSQKVYNKCDKNNGFKKRRKNGSFVIKNIENNALLLFMYDYLRHPHVVNNVVRRHIQIPVYSQTQQTVYYDEWQPGCGCGR